MNKLPAMRNGMTHKAVIHGEPTLCPVCKATIRDGRRKFWVTANRNAEGKVCEVFLHMDEAGAIGPASAMATFTMANRRAFVSSLASCFIEIARTAWLYRRGGTPTPWAPS